MDQVGAIAGTRHWDAWKWACVRHRRIAIWLRCGPQPGVELHGGRQRHHARSVRTAGLLRGRPLVLDSWPSPTKTFLYVQELLRQGQLTDPTVLLCPAGLTPAQLARSATTPTSSSPRCRRRRAGSDRCSSAWDAAIGRGGRRVGDDIGARRELQVVTGPDDYTTADRVLGASQRAVQFYGRSTTRVASREGVRGRAPAARFRGGCFVHATGDRVTPTLPIDGCCPNSPSRCLPCRRLGRDTVPSPVLFRSETGIAFSFSRVGVRGTNPRRVTGISIGAELPRGERKCCWSWMGSMWLGDRSVTGFKTEVNALAGFSGSDYGRVYRACRRDAALWGQECGSDISST